MGKVEPFGQIAVRMGFVAESQVQAALEIQESISKAGKKRRLIGMIMLETGMISTDQLIAILKYYETLEGAEPVGADEDSPAADAGEEEPSELPADN